MEDIVYTVPEVAELLKTSQGLVYRLIKAKLLPSIKIGSIKVRRSRLLEFLEQYEDCDLSNPEKVVSISDFEEEIKRCV